MYRLLESPLPSSEPTRSPIESESTVKFIDLRLPANRVILALSLLLLVMFWLFAGKIADAIVGPVPLRHQPPMTYSTSEYVPTYSGYNRDQPDLLQLQKATAPTQR
jgi:hypothetical protein